MLSLSLPIAKNLEECRRRNSSKSNKNLSLVRDDAQSLPFKRESFDLVSAFSLIETKLLF